VGRIVDGLDIPDGHDVLLPKFDKTFQQRSSSTCSSRASARYSAAIDLSIHIAFSWKAIRFTRRS
jgi:hypothetical protein